MRPLECLTEWAVTSGRRPATSSRGLASSDRKPEWQIAIWQGEEREGAELIRAPPG
jgi:hypothetical protein